MEGITLKKACNILESYWKTKDTRDLEKVFRAYMETLGATPVRKNGKDTSNTYSVDGKSTKWNRVECTYYRMDGSHRKYGQFEFELAFRKRMGNYLLIQTGSPETEIKRIYEISFGDVIRIDENGLKSFLANHEGLFRLMESDMAGEP